MNQKKENIRLDSRPLKVAFICHSDNLGGASVVTRRLVQALNAQGGDARLIVFNKISDDASVQAVTQSRLRRGYPFMMERLGIAMANGFSRENLFKVSTASHGVDLSDHPDVRSADVIVLSWINQGLLSLHGIRRLGRLGKPIVWAMHDMWNLTGICHHSIDCEGYTDRCGRCRYLTGTKDEDLSRRTWEKKKRLYDEVPITFVAVSNWLAECGRRSSLLSGRDLRVIPNAFPVDSFSTTPGLELSRIPSDTRVILMGAARLDDPIKGLGMAVDALNYIFDNDPEVARDTTAVFFGGMNDPRGLEDLRFPHLRFGMINDGRIVRELYARASVVISSSVYETLPGTLIEGQAAGALPVSFDHGGQRDIIDHKKNGYLAEFGNIRDFAEGIKWALANPADRNWLHEQVRERFASDVIARRYIDLFEELLGRHE